MTQSASAEWTGLLAIVGVGRRRKLTQRVGVVPDELRLQGSALSIAQLEALGEALLDFTRLADLENWLQGQ